MSTEHPASKASGTIPFRLVFADELRGCVGGRRFRPEQFPEMSANLTPERAFELGLTGLALSGGSIRSAAFNLGLLQALADRAVLPRCDYLSSVSGGGYIGAALSSLCSEPGAGVGDPSGAFRSAPDGSEPPEVGHIRQHASYLALRRGLLRIDTWRMISAYVGGLVLVAATVAAFLALTTFLAVSFASGGTIYDLQRKSDQDLWLALLQKRVSEFEPPRVPDDRVRAEVVKWLRDFRALVLDASFSDDLGRWIAEARTLPVGTLRERMDAWLFACREHVDDPQRLLEVDEAMRQADGKPPAFKLDSAATRREILEGLWRRPAPYLMDFQNMVLPPLALWATIGGIFLITSFLRGTIREPALRRTLTRSMGYALATSATIAVFTSTPFVHAAIASFRFRELLGVSTLVSLISLVTSLRVTDGKSESSRTVRRLAFNIGAWGLVAAVCLSVIYFAVDGFLKSATGGASFVDAVLIATLVLSLVVDINRVSLLYYYRDRLAEAFVVRRARGVNNPDTSGPVVERVQSGIIRRIGHAIVRALFSLGASPLVALTIAPVAFFSINWSSSGLMVSVGTALMLVGTGAFAAIVRWYKRLLWKSDALTDLRGEERADDIVPNDDLRLTDLAKRMRDAPYLLINTAVNLAGSENLRLRGRKADFFLISPLYCGSEVTGYVPTDRFERGLDNLATAMAVSGAAANPLTGRGTRPAFAFLMTLCNLRPGMWVQNPRYARSREGFHRWFMEAVLHVRRWWPYYIVKELLGKSDERARHINLSDGGHIENLGVFELLRRKCRVIIASDAGADPACTFGDLGDLIRMARVDLGVDIRGVDTGRLRPDPSRHVSDSHAIVGEIVYREENFPGTLIYIKSALTADDPLDLHVYKHRQPRFPHETTINQFFDEEQFEAYRVLGHRSGVAAADLFEQSLTRFADATAAV